LASVTLVRTISFSIYQRSKHVYSDWMGKNLGFCPLEHVNKNGAYPTLGTMACFGAAGATAGSAITFIACESTPLVPFVPRHPITELTVVCRLQAPLSLPK
jgi:hypothetical protein